MKTYIYQFLKMNFKWLSNEGKKQGQGPGKFITQIDTAYMPEHMRRDIGWLERPDPTCDKLDI